MSPVQADGPPNIVALFSGHTIDAPDREAPRFPRDQVPVVAAAIADTLAQVGTKRGDVGICGDACRGDLLFAEAARSRDRRRVCLCEMVHTRNL